MCGVEEKRVHLNITDLSDPTVVSIEPGVEAAALFGRVGDA